MIIYVPQDIHDRLNYELRDIPEKIPDVLRKTINTTAKNSKKIVVEQTKERYTLKKAASRINKSIQIENAVIRYPQATIELKEGSQPTIDFQTRKNSKKNAAKAKVLKSGELKELKIPGGEKNGKELRAFVVAMKNSHVGVFQRVPSRTMKSNPEKTAIKQMYSVPIPMMVGKQEVYQKIEEDIKEELRRSLDKHIAKVLGGM